MGKSSSRVTAAYQRALDFGLEAGEADLNLIAHDRRNVRVGRRRTTISLEPAFWNSLEHIAKLEGSSVDDIITDVDAKRPTDLSRTCGLRIFVLCYFRHRAPARIEEPSWPSHVRARILDSQNQFLFDLSGPRLPANGDTVFFEGKRLVVQDKTWVYSDSPDAESVIEIRCASEFGTYTAPSQNVQVSVDMDGLRSSER